LLTNLGTASMQLLQIILIGQPELRTLLQREDMRQLAQRVTARYHLEPVTREDTEAYIKHRLRISGTTRPLFNKASIDLIYRLSGGIPRLINVLCDRALLGAYSEGKLQIDRKIVRQAAQELTGSELPSSRLDPGPRWLFIGAAGLILLGIALYAYWRGPQSGRAPDQRAVQASVAQATADQGATAMRANERSVVDPAPQAPMAQAADDLPEASIPDSPDRPLSTEAEPASLAALLAEFDDTRALAAWTGLFSRWSVKLPADVAPEYCVFASDVGLYCLVGQGSWGLLRQYNRPAVIGLVSGDGQTVPALLQHLDGQLAELLVGEETLRLPTGEVDRYWLGDFTLLLRSPPNGHLLLRAGDRNADVLWLRQLLEQAQQTKLTSDDPQYFDFPLQKQVLEFQRSHGLTADGVVGKDTLLQLNTYGDRQVPLLSVEAP
jgi:general secretion pathway protein A